MPGFLDQSAPSPEAEYSRYLDGDILGKLIAKNFLMNRVGYSANDIYIPVGRYGDADIKFGSGAITRDPGDGHIQTPSGKITFEIKCARINIANRHAGQTAENWAFTNIRLSPAKVHKKYDILIAIGVLVRGMEDSSYWGHLKRVQEEYKSKGLDVVLDAKPHESAFLNICGFFVVPFGEIPTNFFRLTIPRISKSATYSRFFAWGHDMDRCKSVRDYARNGISRQR